MLLRAYQYLPRDFLLKYRQLVVWTETLTIELNNQLAYSLFSTLKKVRRFKNEKKIKVFHAQISLAECPRVDLHSFEVIFS